MFVAAQFVEDFKGRISGVGCRGGCCLARERLCCTPTIAASYQTAIAAPRGCLFETGTRCNDRRFDLPKSRSGIRKVSRCWNECNFVANESFLIKYVPSKFYTSTENDPPIDIPIIRYFLKDKKERKILPGSRREKNKKKYILSREMEKFEVDRLERVDETV